MNRVLKVTEYWAAVQAISIGRVRKVCADASAAGKPSLVSDCCIGGGIQSREQVTVVLSKR
jgi:hypothetical protein